MASAERLTKVARRVALELGVAKNIAGDAINSWRYRHWREPGEMTMTSTRVVSESRLSIPAQAWLDSAAKFGYLIDVDQTLAKPKI